MAVDQPSVSHPFGLDKYGRDILARVIYGSQYDLCIAIAAVGLAVMAATAIGGASGFIGVAIDHLLIRSVEMLLAFPNFIGLRFIPLYARLVRAEVMGEKMKGAASPLAAPRPW